MNIWRVNYFATALGCNFPIVEAIQNNNIVRTVESCVVERVARGKADIRIVWNEEDYVIYLVKKCFTLRLWLECSEDTVFWSISRGKERLRASCVALQPTWSMLIEKVAAGIKQNLRNIFIGLEKSWVEQESLLLMDSY